ncbi:MAG: hypothetical protein WDN46_02420 [Methylocella sp.]
MIDATFAAEALCGSATVPEKLIGCWERRYIRFSNGAEDTTTRVVWLQTASGVGDIRVGATRPNLRARSGLDGCARDDLLALAEQDCFCGVTLFDPHGEPFPTASWPSERELFRFQPVVTFPEPGWLEWRDAGACMIERAPSGAYEEDWRLQPYSRSFAAHLLQRSASMTTCLYIAGDHAIRARSRSLPITQKMPLAELARKEGYDLPTLRKLMDCEFSYARRRAPGDDYTIELSTLPWREGHLLGCAWVEGISSQDAIVRDPASNEEWFVESLWRS